MHRVIRACCFPRGTPLPSLALLPLHPRDFLHPRVVEILQYKSASIPPCLANSLCEGGEIVVGIVVFYIVDAEHFPTKWRGDARRMRLT